LAAVIVVNAALAAAGLGSTGQRPGAEVAMPTGGVVELPAAGPKATPVAPQAVSDVSGAAAVPAGVAAGRKTAAAARKTAAAQTRTPAATGSARGRSNAVALQQWRSALADRANHPADVVVVGDSITEGYFVADADRWISRLRAHLQATNPAGVAGGEGFIPAWHVGRRIDSTVPVWSQRWTLNGFSDDWVDTGYGLGRRALVFDDARQTASITVRADRVWVAYTEGPGRGLVRVTVDSGLPVLIDTKAAVIRSGRIWDSGPLPTGAHTVTVAAVPGNTAVLDGIMAFQGDGGSGANRGRGVRVWDGGHGMYASREFADGMAYWAQGFDVISPDLVVIELGVNDEFFDRTPGALRTNLTRIVDGIRQQSRASGAPDPSIAFTSLWAPGHRPAADWEPYRAATLAAAADRGCAVLDAWSELRQAPSKPTTDGLFIDTIHPNPAGHRWLGDTVDRLLAA
jgi:lysophospholipase L1-like esterase